MGKKETATKEDMMAVVSLFENMGILYWVDGGWGVELLTAKQTRAHRDIDINFDAQHTEKLLDILSENGYKVGRAWKRLRIIGKRYSGLSAGRIIRTQTGGQRR